jgi:hypothetical protein
MGVGRPGAAALATVVVLMSCANDDADLFPDLGEPPAEVSLSRDVQPIFTASCALAGCHAGSAPQEEMTLEEGRLFDPQVGIVGVPSRQAPGRNRVLPGRSDLSYLVNKIEGTQVAAGGSGEQMPRNAPPLSDDAVRRIVDWIDQGARDN